MGRCLANGSFGEAGYRKTAPALVLDSNIVFAAIIKDSLIRRLFGEYPSRLLFPEIALEELDKYHDLLHHKSGLSPQQLWTLHSIIFSRIELIRSSLYAPYLEYAKFLMRHIDIGDIPFIACALSYPKSIIWSEDKALKKQRNVPVMNTAEILQMLRNSLF